MRSLGPKKPMVRAWSADFATCAVPITSKAFITAPIGPFETKPNSLTRPRYSLHPPHAGIIPTPTSTNPT